MLVSKVRRNLRTSRPETEQRKVLLTANRHTHNLAIRVEDRNVDIGRQVATIQVRREIGIPVEFNAENEIYQCTGRGSGQGGGSDRMVRIGVDTMITRIHRAMVTMQ